MPSCLMRFHHTGQGNLLESFQQALRRWMSRCSLGITRIQPCQSSAFLGQVTTDHELQQRQDPQRNRQQPHQTRGMIVPLDIHGRERQRVSLQASEGALHQILVAVGLDCLGQRESVCHLVRGVHTPAQLLNGPRQGFRFHLAAARSPVRSPSPRAVLPPGSALPSRPPLALPLPARPAPACPVALLRGRPPPSALAPGGRAGPSPLHALRPPSAPATVVLSTCTTSPRSAP